MDQQWQILITRIQRLRQNMVVLEMEMSADIDCKQISVMPIVQFSSIIIDTEKLTHG